MPYPAPTFRQRLGLLRSIAIYHGRPWRRPRLRRFYAQFIQSGDLVFDIGAHVGNRAQQFAALGARVIAFEPQPLFHQYLLKRFTRLPEIEVLPYAVGAKPGQAPMQISHTAPTVSTLATEWIERVKQDDETFSRVEWDHAVLATVTTLDEAIIQYGRPAFVKIDVEGYELEVLTGLSQPIPALSLEFLRSTLDMSLACIDRLEELGRYEYNYTIVEGTQLQSPQWLTPIGIKNALGDLPPSATSGDIYARLVSA